MPEATNILEILDRPAFRNQTAVVLPDQGISITYGKLRDQVLSLAESLALNGIVQGSRVALVLSNGLPALAGFLAASITGTAAPLNPAYKRQEFEYYLNDTGATALICPEAGSEEAAQAATGRARLFSIETDPQGGVKLSGARGAGRLRPPEPQDTALVLHTSGSTGSPKCVPIRHANLLASAHNIVRTYALTPADSTLCVMPLFHVHGLVASCLASLVSGGAIVLPSKFNPLQFRRLVRDYGVTWYSAVPAIHQMVLPRSGGRLPGAHRLRFVRSCSSALHPALFGNMEAAFGVPVLEAYGMTEASHQMCSNPIPPGVRKPGSVGLGTGAEVAIFDKDGTAAGTGQRGEIVVRGPGVVSGYENNPEANAQSFVRGWFRTGDQGFVDEEGYVTLTGRIKELINRGGEKIAPREIDEALLGHPDVAEAAAFGFPHPTWGEEIAAAVVLRNSNSEPEILAHCRARLAEFKCPKKLYILPAIPRTATGKIQRNALAATLAENGR
jgi:acyl-CoA synthetase (AMP-forming)/AMP-acid ligase II